MATKAELEKENKDLKKQIRELKKGTQLSDLTLNEEIWGVVTYKPTSGSDTKKHKVVQLKYDYETKQGVIAGEMAREFRDVDTALGYATRKNNEHIIKRAQGRK